MVRLPAQPCVSLRSDPTWKLGFAIQPRDGADRHRTLGEPAVEDQRAQNQRHRGARMLAPNVEQELALLGGQLARAATVGARVGLEAIEAIPLVGVVPTLERRGAIALRGAPAWGAVPHLGELGPHARAAGRYRPSGRAAGGGGPALWGAWRSGQRARRAIARDEPASR